MLNRVEHEISFITSEPDNFLSFLLHLGWLVGWVYWPFETVFQSISGRLPETGRKKRNER